MPSKPFATKLSAQGTKDVTRDTQHEHENLETRPMAFEELAEGELEEIELIVAPVPPHTVDDVKATLEATVRQSLGAAGQAHLWDQDVALDLERPFPTDTAVTALLFLASGVALKTFEATLLPDIQRQYQVRVKRRQRHPKDQVYVAPRYRTQLRQWLSAHFDEEELRTLCFDLGLSYDDLRGEGAPHKARELVAYLERRGRIPELVALGKRARPHLDWDDAPAATG
jgi:hypothetical protein